MDEYEQQEQQKRLQEKIQYLDEMGYAAQLKARRDAMISQQRVTERIISKKMKKRGFTPESWQRALSSDPETVMQLMENAVDDYVKGVSKVSGRPKEPRMRPTSSRPPRQAESRSRGDFQELREKAHKGTITEEEQVHALEKMLGWDR
jgi:hypothetical protein